MEVLILESGERLVLLLYSIDLSGEDSLSEPEERGVMVGGRIEESDDFLERNPAWKRFDDFCFKSRDGWGGVGVGDDPKESFDIERSF